MLKCSKQVFVVLLLLVIPVLSLGTACSKEEPADERITSPVEIPYLTRNPLEILTDEKMEGDYYNRTFIIQGLTDKKIQETINEDLKSAYARVLEGKMPPYRGIRQRIPEGSTVMGSSIDASMSFNYNNVASVLITGNRTYRQQDTEKPTAGTGYYPDGSVNVGIAEGYTVDLSTGKQIALKDFFADDVDYKMILNDYISGRLEKSNATDDIEEYFDMGGNLKLVSPFKGISDQQKFYIYQGGIGLIMDYTNPEFDLNFYPATIYVNFQELGDVVAIAKRFVETETDLYVSSDPPVYEFIQEDSGEVVREQNNESIDKINVYHTLQYSRDIPAQALEKVLELGPIDEDKLKEMKDATDTNSEAWNSFEQHAWTGRIGEYTLVSRNTSMYFNDRWKSESENFCYDRNGRLLEMKDLFVAGYNYENLIRKGLKNAADQMTSAADYDLEELYDKLGFTLGLSEISFTTIPVKVDPNQEFPLYFSITYEEIGCGNLTLFN